MRATMFAFIIIAVSMHHYARQHAQTAEQVFTAHRVVMASGSPVVLR